MQALRVPDSCLDLSPIRAEHVGRLQAALDRCAVKARFHYVPRLLFDQRSDRRLLFEEVEGSILLYNLRRTRPDSPPELRLYVPPFPFDAAALGRARERMRSVNRDRLGRIDWVQDADAALIAGHGFATNLREREFIYDRAAVAEGGGAAFKRLRQNLALLKRHGGLSWRDYAATDEAACSALYQAFRARLQAKGLEVTGSRSMANCLRDAPRVPASLLRGEVVEVDGVVRGYSFGGRISPLCGCVFVIVSDHDIPGLGYALRHRMMRGFPEIPLFNDSTDNGRAGLRELKERFRPVEMHAVHSAREVG